MGGQPSSRWSALALALAHRHHQELLGSLIFPPAPLSSLLSPGSTVQDVESQLGDGRKEPSRRSPFCIRPHNSDPASAAGAE